jgi:hypothetical protein
MFPPGSKPWSGYTGRSMLEVHHTLSSTQGAASGCPRSLLLITRTSSIPVTYLPLTRSRPVASSRCRHTGHTFGFAELRVLNRPTLHEQRVWLWKHGRCTPTTFLTTQLTFYDRHAAHEHSCQPRLTTNQYIPVKHHSVLPHLFSSFDEYLDVAQANPIPASRSTFLRFATNVTPTRRRALLIAIYEERPPLCTVDLAHR